MFSCQINYGFLIAVNKWVKNIVACYCTSADPRILLTYTKELDFFVLVCSTNTTFFSTEAWPVR